MSETVETAGHNGAESYLKPVRDLLWYGVYFTLVFVAVCIFNLYKDFSKKGVSFALTRAPKYVYNLVNVLFSVVMMTEYLVNTSELLHQRYFLVIHRCLFPYQIFSIWFYCAITIYGEETLRDNVLRIGYYATFAFWCFWCCVMIVQLHLMEGNGSDVGPIPFCSVMAFATIYYSGELNWISRYIWKEKKEA
jgi:hypothetical protein